MRSGLTLPVHFGDLRFLSPNHIHIIHVCRSPVNVRQKQTQTIDRFTNVFKLYACPFNKGCS